MASRPTKSSANGENPNRPSLVSMPNTSLRAAATGARARPRPWEGQAAGGSADFLKEGAPLGFDRREAVADREGRAVV